MRVVRGCNEGCDRAKLVLLEGSIEDSKRAAIKVVRASMMVVRMQPAMMLERGDVDSKRAAMRVVRTEGSIEPALKVVSATMKAVEGQQ